MTEEQIVNSYKNAINPTKQVKILAELNLTSKDKIISVLESNGVKVKKPKPRKRYPKMSDEDRKKIIDMYNEGVTYKEMGKAMNRTPAIIHKFIARIIESGEIERNPNRRINIRNKNE